ncbi:MAG: hypothetical protein KBT44_03430 [Bacteroidales bacterium]|nr:hypothetical protein [Candidatus Equibacterium intestinale]
MNRKNFLISVIALTLSASIASAQNSALEVMGGYSMQPYSVKGDVRTAAGILGGGNIFIRYTYFFGKHFGVFAQIGLENTYGDGATFFSTRNKADGECYLYRFNGHEGYESGMNIYSVGAAYRWNVGIFRFTPMLAVGGGDFSGYNYSYERRSRSGGSGPEFYTIKPEGYHKSYDYLIDECDERLAPTPMLVSADFLVAVMPDRRLFLFVQPGVTLAPFRIGVKTTGCGSVPRYSPSNWAETVAYAGAADCWVKDAGSDVTSTERCFISPFLHLSVGVGINFGYKNKR